MRKPRPIVAGGEEWGSIFVGKERAFLKIASMPGWFRLFNLKEARRLRAWLDKAIEYLEEREGRG